MLHHRQGDGKIAGQSGKKARQRLGPPVEEAITTASIFRFSGTFTCMTASRPIMESFTRPFMPLILLRVSKILACFTADMEELKRSLE
jgi:hypothetical protein